MLFWHCVYYLTWTPTPRQPPCPEWWTNTDEGTHAFSGSLRVELTVLLDRVVPEQWQQAVMVPSRYGSILQPWRNEKAYDMCVPLSRPHWVPSGHKPIDTLCRGGLPKGGWIFAWFGRARTLGLPSPWSEGNAAPRVSMQSKVFVHRWMGKWDRGRWQGVSREQPPSGQGWAQHRLHLGLTSLHAITTKTSVLSRGRDRTQISLSSTFSCSGHSPQPHKKQRTRTSGPFWRK